MSELRGLDNWITSGRYHVEYLLVTCNLCGENTIVMAETQYGGTWWNPEECSNCHTFFVDDVIFEQYYPEEDYD